MRNSKLIVSAVVSLSLVVGIGAASAADMAVKAPVYKAPAVVATYNWTGWYGGVNAGYGWNDHSYNFIGDNVAGALLVDPTFIGIGQPRSIKTSGFIGGGQVGYNWQFNRNWLVGLEADIDYANVRGDSSFPTGNLDFFGHVDHRLQWLGTSRARIGFLPTDRLLAYVTGGLAYGQTHADSNLSITSSGSTVSTAGSDGTTLNCGGGPIGTCMTGSDSRTSLGWVVGGGLEYGISNSVSLKAEYLYVGLPSQSVLMVAGPPSGTGNGLVSTRSFDNAYQFVRFGMNYHFATY